ncbi:MAG TPA: hypothetical protein PKV71_14655 [Calditrichia bacterium]|nr:hypothetical protein [Calditrichota bacterium]HQV33123.1 hypothetical protein [Calditrichia bacterium]
MKFVRITQDPDEQFARYQAVKHFMKTLTECKTEACMEQKIYGKEAPEGFSDRYLLEHETAAQGLQLTSREAARLMKSGFEVAMNRLDKKFLQQ